jgi:hypothetical protein
MPKCLRVLATILLSGFAAGATHAQPLLIPPTTSAPVMRAIPKQPEIVIGAKFWADFASQALAAIAGAGVGALLGAKYAFGLERTKAQAEKVAAAERFAIEQRRQHAAAGNLAVFTLAKIHNDLLTYNQQFMVKAKQSKAPWFWLAPSDVDRGNFHQFDIPSLAFLLQSKSPALLMALSLEQSRFAAFLNAVQLRCRVHQEQMLPTIEKHRIDSSTFDEDIQKVVGRRIYYTLDNFFSDIDTLLTLGIQSSKAIGDELRALLISQLPGEMIIGFEAEDIAAMTLSPVEAARRRASSQRATP